MNRTVLLDATPCSLVYTTTLKRETRRYISTSPHGVTYPKTGFQQFLFIVTSIAHTKFRELLFANCHSSGWCKGDEINDRWMTVGWWYDRTARGCMLQDGRFSVSDLWITVLHSALRTAGILQKLESGRTI